MRQLLQLMAQELAAKFPINQHTFALDSAGGPGVALLRARNLRSARTSLRHCTKMQVSAIRVIDKSALAGKKKAQPIGLRLKSTKGGGFGGLSRTIAVRAWINYLSIRKRMQAVSIAAQ
jgi:hypothetical protein